MKDSNSLFFKCTALIGLTLFLFSCGEIALDESQAAAPQAEENVIIVYSSPVVPEGIAEAADVLEPDYFGGESSESTRAVTGAGPLVGVNSIYFKIDTRANSESTASYIDIKFGTMNFRLYSYSGDYQQGSEHYIEFSDHKEWFESWDQDLWDDISFSITGTDGIYFSQVKIIHSDQVILDYTPATALDYPDHSPLSFNSAMLTYKYSQLGTTHGIVREGLKELGKTDGDKYGTTGAWCSEFASWCIRSYGYSTPTGSIGTSDMRTYYQDNDRYKNVSQVYNKSYTLGAGDYMAINGESHSIIFAEWVGNPTTFDSSTEFRTIEGNSGSAVRIKTRSLACVDFIGQN